MKKLISILVASLAVVGLSATSASATAFSVVVSKSTNIAFAGETVTVNISGIPTDAGFYVRQCVSVPTVRPTACNGQGQWVSTSATWRQRGAGDASAPISLPVDKTFTAADNNIYNCAFVACEIFVRLDHLAPSDTSLDTHIPLTFTPVGVTLNKSTAIADGGENLTVTLTGIPSGNGVYIRQCQQSQTSARPTLCNGMGVWTSLDPGSQAQTATDATLPQTLPVAGLYTSNSTTVDCNKVVCGIFIRRDHLGASDLSLDTFIPLTFSTPVKSSQTIVPSLATGTHSVLKGKYSVLSADTMKTRNGQALVWSTSNASLCSVSSANHKKVVNFKKVGTCVVTARALGTNRLKQTDFKWTFKINAR